MSQNAVLRARSARAYFQADDAVEPAEGSLTVFPVQAARGGFVYVIESAVAKDVPSFGSGADKKTVRTLAVAADGALKALPLGPLEAAAEKGHLVRPTLDGLPDARFVGDLDYELAHYPFFLGTKRAVALAERALAQQASPLGFSKRKLRLLQVLDEAKQASSESWGFVLPCRTTAVFFEPIPWPSGTIHPVRAPDQFVALAVDRVAPRDCGTTTSPDCVRFSEGLSQAARARFTGAEPLSVKRMAEDHRLMQGEKRAPDCYRFHFKGRHWTSSWSGANGLQKSVEPADLIWLDVALADNRATTELRPANPAKPTDMHDPYYSTVKPLLFPTAQAAAYQHAHAIDLKGGKVRPSPQIAHGWAASAGVARSGSGDAFPGMALGYPAQGEVEIMPLTFDKSMTPIFAALRASEKTLGHVLVDTYGLAQNQGMVRWELVATAYCVTQRTLEGSNHFYKNGAFMQSHAAAGTSRSTHQVLDGNALREASATWKIDGAMIDRLIGPLDEADKKYGRYVRLESRLRFVGAGESREVPLAGESRIIFKG